MIDREVDTTGPDAPVEDVETSTHLAADEIEREPLFGPDDTKIGHIHRLMINKATGLIDYAIVTNAGLFGVGDYLPVRWTAFRYEEALGGYRCDLTAETLKEQGRELVEDVEMRIW